MWYIFSRDSWVRTLLLAVLLLAILLIFAYAVFCDRIGSVAEFEPLQTVVLCGVVADVCEETGVYRLEDPTGRVFVSGRTDVPRKGTAAIVTGKIDFTETGRPLVRETRRVGTF